MALILVIDDSLFQRRLIKKVIRSLNHEILEAENGRIGLDMLEKHTPDCILLDLMMPDVDGFEVLEKLQKRPIHIPTIVITADIQESTARQCYERGALAVLYKPARSDEVRNTLQQVLAEAEDV